MSQIIVFTSNHCEPCRLVKEFFWSKGIDFTEVNINATGAIEWMKDYTDNTYPPLTIKDKKFVQGYDEKKLKELINE